LWVYCFQRLTKEDALDNNSKEDKKDILDNDKSPEVLKDEDQDKDTDDKMTNKKRSRSVLLIKKFIGQLQKK